LLAVKVSCGFAVVGFGVTVAVTPLGNPMAAKLTLPLNPYSSVTVMVPLELPPGLSDRPYGAAIAKAAGVIVKGNVVEADKAPEVPVTVMVLVPNAALAFATRTIEL
jgi:hypothetical protein